MLLERLLVLAKLLVGFVLIGVQGLVLSVVLVLFLPWRLGRIRACNVWGSTAGSTAMWLSGCPLSIQGREDMARPALYVSNHTSIFDIFLGMWLSPLGTVGVAKKEIVWYPILGQIYLLSGHLRIDRSNRDRAVASLQALGELVRRHNLSIFMWPEGTRSRTGQLLPFKKGFAHLAVATGLPIVPMVVRGAQHAWEKNTLLLRPVPIEVEFLPPIDTTGWSVDTLQEHIYEVHAAFGSALPPEQQPG